MLQRIKFVKIIH